MYNVGFIPVRAGSKGVKGKNLRLLAGHPLVYWTAKAAYASMLDKVYISTDSDEIADVVNGFGFDKLEVVHRSETSASDTATSESALIEFSERYEFDNVVFMQATSPLTRTEDIDGGLKKFLKSDRRSLISVVHNHQFLWDGDGRPLNYDPMNRPRRQDWDGYYIENGAFYISSRKDILKSGCRITPPVDYWVMEAASFFEVDTERDFELIERFIV